MSPKPISHCVYLSFYEGQFLSAYNKMLNSLHEPDNNEQDLILKGITDSLVHLAHSCNSNLVEPEVSTHISLAMNALIEDTYSCYENIIFSISQEISVVSKDPQKAKYCITDIDYGKFKKELKQFNELRNHARNEKRTKPEMGRTAIKAYQEAISLGESLLSKIDWAKEEEFELRKKTNEKVEVLPEESLSFIEQLIKLITCWISKHPWRIAGIMLTAITSVIWFIMKVLANTFVQQWILKHIAALGLI